MESMSEAEKKDIPLRKMPYKICAFRERAGGKEYQFKRR